MTRSPALVIAYRSHEHTLLDGVLYPLPVLTLSSLVRLPQSDSSSESDSLSSESSRVAAEKRLVSCWTVWVWGAAPDEERVGE